MQDGENVFCDPNKSCCLAVRRWGLASSATDTCVSLEEKMGLRVASTELVAIILEETVEVVREPGA